MKKSYRFQITIRDEGDGQIAVEFSNKGGHDFDHKKDKPTPAIILVDEVMGFINKICKLTGPEKGEFVQ